jgi:hypothetical protein
MMMTDTKTEAPAAVTAAAETVDEMLAPVPGDSDSAMAELAARLGATEAALAEANEELRDLRQERDDLSAALTKANAAAEKAKNAAKASKGVQGPKARTFRLGGHVSERLSAEDLKAVLSDAETVEVVFCDGGKEVLGIPPVRVQGDAWSVRSQGLLLTVPVLVHGPGAGHAAYTVDGFGLVIDGKPEIHARRVNGQLTIGAGAQMNIADDIIF